MDIRDFDNLVELGDTYTHRHLSNRGIRGGYVWSSGPWHTHNLDGTGQANHIHSPREPEVPKQTPKSS